MKNHYLLKIGLSFWRMTCILLFGLLYLLIGICNAQNVGNAPAQSPDSIRANQSNLSKFTLEDGTPIKMRITRTISSADAHVNDRVDFQTLEDIKIGDIMVIPKGSIAWGTVTQAAPKRRLGRGGKLNVVIDSVRLMDGEKSPLRAVKEVKGGGHQGAMTGGMVATGIVFFPAAPLFLFMHGKDITVPQGTEITAYVNGDMALDRTRFIPADSAPTQPTAQAADAKAHVESAPIDISSSPDGAEISLDDKYAGNTPSTLTMAPGEHVIAIGKSGFKPWKRTISVTPGSHLTISAQLESDTTPAIQQPAPAGVSSARPVSDEPANIGPGGNQSKQEETREEPAKTAPPAETKPQN